MQGTTGYGDSKEKGILIRSNKYFYMGEIFKSLSRINFEEFKSTRDEKYWKNFNSTIFNIFFPFDIN